MACSYRFVPKYVSISMTCQKLHFMRVACHRRNVYKKYFEFPVFVHCIAHQLQRRSHQCEEGCYASKMKKIHSHQVFYEFSRNIVAYKSGVWTLSYHEMWNQIQNWHETGDRLPFYLHFSSPAHFALFAVNVFLTKCRDNSGIQPFTV